MCHSGARGQGLGVNGVSEGYEDSKHWMQVQKDGCINLSFMKEGGKPWEGYGGLNMNVL